MPRYVTTIEDIPSEDLQKMRARLMNQLASMNEADLRTIAKSEASFKAFIAGAFKAIAEFFGYVFGQVISTIEGIAKGIGDGLTQGWKDGYRSN